MYKHDFNIHTVLTAAFGMRYAFFPRRGARESMAEVALSSVILYNIIAAVQPLCCVQDLAPPMLPFSRIIHGYAIWQATLKIQHGQQVIYITYQQ